MDDLRCATTPMAMTCKPFSSPVLSFVVPAMPPPTPCMTRQTTSANVNKTEYDWAVRREYLPLAM
jgi:hypothetical protein